MKKFAIYEPAMCCSTGLCGPDISPELLHFNNTVIRLKKLGVAVERFNLSQQPLAFTQNAMVAEALRKHGPEVLPLVFIDDRPVHRGRYPDAAEQRGLLDSAAKAGKL